MTKRALTERERALALSMFHHAIDLDRVAINHRCWWPLQPRNVIMAPDGEIWCHPAGALYRECFASSDLGVQGLFLHELTHVWQSQQRGRFYLPLMRHPFCRYRYDLIPGMPFERYGLEQQGEIIRHAFLLRAGARLTGLPALEQYEKILPFGRQ